MSDEQRLRDIVRHGNVILEKEMIRAVLVVHLLVAYDNLDAHVDEVLERLKKVNTP